MFEIQINLKTYSDNYLIFIGTNGIKLQLLDTLLNQMRRIPSGHRNVHKLRSGLQIERLSLLGEDKRRDGIDIGLLQTLNLHLSLESWQRIDRNIAEIRKTRETVLVVSGIGTAHVARVADAAHSSALHGRQLEFANWL